MCYYVHFTAKERAAERLSNLPKVTQLCATAYSFNHIEARSTLIMINEGPDGTKKWDFSASTPFLLEPAY